MSITNWEAKKKARSIEAKAEQDSGAKHGTISARKSLLPGAVALDEIIKHSAAMRTWWNNVSAPWFDNGMRIYGIAGHFDIQTAFGDMARHRDGLIAPATAAEIVRLMAIHNFRWKATGEAGIGAFAQELHRVYPLAVTPGHWVEPDDGGERYWVPWQVDYSALVPVMVAAWQHLDARLSAMEAAL